MAWMLHASLLAPIVMESSAHGTLTYPPARSGGNFSFAGLASAYASDNVGLWWFSQPVVIPGEPLLNEQFERTYNVHVSSGKTDWSRQMPWRAPGTAPVLGSGCGVSGGSPVPVPNGGRSANEDLYPFGMDGKDLPATAPTQWMIGGTAEVAFALLANHGGGYSYRLCKKSSNIAEECFQQNVLQFHGEVSWLQYTDLLPRRDAPGKFLHLPRVPIPRVVVPTDKVHPAGSHWARNPIPSCLYCDQSKCGGALPNLSEPVTDPAADCAGNPKGCFGGDAWFQQEKCAQQCSGFNLMQCPPGMTQFAEPAPGISGYLGSFLYARGGSIGLEGFQYSIVDEIKVPEYLEAGEYLLSWRWDAEQSPQVWQNCADVTLVANTIQV